jgi:hypothetical protein
MCFDIPISRAIDGATMQVLPIAGMRSPLSHLSSFLCCSCLAMRSDCLACLHVSPSEQTTTVKCTCLTISLFFVSYTSITLQAQQSAAAGERTREYHKERCVCVAVSVFCVLLGVGPFVRLADVGYTLRRGRRPVGTDRAERT